MALPGEELVHRGVADLHAGRDDTAEALLVAIGAHRLRDLGLDVPPCPSDPEDRLYRLLAAEEPESAHSRYNALIARLVSYERAAECVSR